MASITMSGLTKVYPNGYEAVHAIDLEVHDDELLVLVGPSGCGKTTVLRMVAGLEQVTDGTLSIGDRVVNGVRPEDRDIAMVFQNYALYPHMTVERNIGFSLSLRRTAKPQMKSQIAGAADVLGLTPWLQRKPAQLSGGQRQRVAMGRAIVREPAAFLMDEPLSNLDAKLRVQMRTEVIRLHRRLGVATIYVTHDQTEAMTMGTKVAVMRDGNVEQVAAPQTLYERPANVFVATFIGSPATNVFEAELRDGRLRLGSHELVVPEAVYGVRPGLRAYEGRSLLLGLRPEHLSLARNENGVIGGDVDLVESLGSELLVYFASDARRVLTSDASEEERLSNALNAVARLDPRDASRLRAGDHVEFAVDLGRALYFDADSGHAIDSSDLPAAAAS